MQMRCKFIVDSLCSLESLIIELCEIAMNFEWCSKWWVMLLLIIMGARFVCFLGYNPFRIWIKLSFIGHIHAAKSREWCWIHSRNISDKQRTGQKCLSDLILEPVLAKLPQRAFWARSSSQTKSVCKLYWDRDIFTRNFVSSNGR